MNIYELYLRVAGVVFIVAVAIHESSFEVMI